MVRLSSVIADMHMFRNERDRCRTRRIELAANEEVSHGIVLRNSAARKESNGDKLGSDDLSVDDNDPQSEEVVV